MDNTTKAREDNNPNFLDNEGNPKRGNKRGERPYDKKNDNKNKKVRIAKLNKYHGKRKKFEP